MINTINHNLNIDLANKINMNQSISIKKNDTNSHKFIINIFSNSLGYDLTGTTARIYFEKLDNTKVFLNCTLDDAINGKMSSLLTTQCLSCVGLVACEITIYGTSGEILTSVTFNFDVEDIIRDDTSIQSTSEFTALTNALLTVNQYDARIASNAAALSAIPSQIYITEKAKQVDLDATNTKIALNATQIASLASGSPKGAFATLDSLNATFPTGATGTYIVAPALYFWNGSAWSILIASYQNALLANGGVTQDNIIGVITNILNKATNTINTKLAYSAGVVTTPTNVNYTTTDYIPVKTGDILNITRGIAAYIVFNAAKGVLAYVGSGSTTQITISMANADSIRMSYTNDALDTMVIKNNAIPTDYLDYGKSIISWLPILNLSNSKIHVLNGLIGTNKILIDTVAKTTTLKTNTLFIAGDINSFYTGADKVTAYTPTTYETNLMSLYYNIDDQILNLINYNAGLLTNKHYLFLGSMYRAAGDLYYTFLTANEFNKKAVTINGLLPYDTEKIASPVDLTSGYDFANAKIIIPDNLYLIKGIDYEIQPDTFLSIDRSNNKDLKFEMIMPTYSELSRDSIRVGSPIAQVFDTKIAIIQSNDLTKEIAKNVRLNFKDTSTIVNKNMNVVIIGDSIQANNIPGIVAMWLKQWGLNPTMVGTVADNGTGTGYGPVPQTTTLMGEGRGGWRTTDFLNITKNLDGSHFNVMYSYIPMWDTTGVFNFSDYITKNFLGVVIDYVIIALGTNDLGGGHYSGHKELLYLPTTNELLVDTTSPYYMPKMLDTMINSIKTHNPSVKIGIAPTQIAGVDGNFNQYSKQLANLEEQYYRGVANVYVLGQYLAQARYSGEWQQDIVNTDKFTDNKTYNMPTTTNVHRNMAAQQNTGLWFASWIANMLS